LIATCGLAIIILSRVMPCLEHHKEKCNFVKILQERDEISEN